jgi:hypothetical protein
MGYITYSALFVSRYLHQVLDLVLQCEDSEEAAILCLWKGDLTNISTRRGKGRKKSGRGNYLILYNNNRVASAPRSLSVVKGGLNSIHLNSLQKWLYIGSQTA